MCSKVGISSDISGFDCINDTFHNYSKDNNDSVTAAAKKTMHPSAEPKYCSSGKFHFSNIIMMLR